MTFYPVMGSSSAVWHDQRMNKAPKTRRQGILGGSRHMANKGAGSTSSEPHPNSHPSLPGDTTIGDNARIRNQQSTSTPVEWKDSFEAPLSVVVRGSGRRQSGSQERVAKKQNPINLRLNRTQRLVPDQSSRRSGLESVAQWYAARECRPPPLAERPIPAKGSTHVHGLLDQ